ncbi:MAG TPA: response regulator [Candidatus Angelobacter sp.]|jgi:CheY-like chemotaxis protein|nr:response regulator [Candidatus Angelobacter sp.]
MNNDEFQPRSNSIRALKLLIVEDDLPSLELMSEVLRSLEVQVSAVSDSQRAARMVVEQKFDGIFADLQMPGMDGFALIRRIRESSWNCMTPVVVVTAQDNRTTMDTAFKAGATFFLQKPIDRRKLIMLLNTTRGSMLANRRRFRRMPLRLGVAVKTPAQQVNATTVDISENGMLLACPISLEIGDVLQLGFSLPKEEGLIEVTALVKRVDAERNAGVVFTRVNSEDQHRISIFIDAMESHSPARVPMARAR